MKLIYRGQTYDYNPSTPRNDESNGSFGSVRRFQKPYQLIYRGNTYQVDPNAKPAQNSAPRTAHTLIYRGATYVVNESGQLESTTASSAKAKAPRIPNSLTQQDVARVHHSNIVRNLQRRLEVAQQRGDQNLISLLESELRQIA